MITRASTTGTDGPYESSPAAALRAIGEHRDALLLDLDETLYLRNSSEDFIDSARPAVLARVLLRLLDVLKPWRATRGPPTRDVWRVAAIMTFFPWTFWVWKRRARALAKRFSNDTLIAAVRRSAARPCIVTVGFRPIVRPLLEAMGLARAELVAARWFAFEDRIRGKMDLAIRALGPTTVERSLVVTDSKDDLPLLRRCARPHRVTWPGARFIPAHVGVYLPGDYLTKIKRPGTRYVFRSILQEDFAFWVLSSVALRLEAAPHTPWKTLGDGTVFIAGLSLLLLSFWAIYERGYVDNDRIAARYERVPALSKEYWTTTVPTSSRAAWCWAVSAGVAGASLLGSHAAPWLDSAKWLAVLAATHAIFWFYNRIDKSTRVWLYGGLQFARSAAFVVLVPISTVGAMALASHILSRWVPYFTYRFESKKSWPQVPSNTTRLLFLSILSGLVMITSGAGSVINATGLAVWALCTYRAIPELKTILRTAHRIDHHDEPPSPRREQEGIQP